MLVWVDDRSMDRMDIERPEVLSGTPDVRRKKTQSYPIPNSSQFVFPIIVAPESLNSWTTVASKGDLKSRARTVNDAHASTAGKLCLPRSIAEEHVVGIFLVHILSFTATVMSCNGPSEMVPSSSGATYTSAFTLSFLFCTVTRQDA